jgi:hypothetical protein
VDGGEHVGERRDPEVCSVDKILIDHRRSPCRWRPDSPASLALVCYGSREAW